MVLSWVVFRAPVALRIRNAARTKFDTAGVDFSGHAVDVNMDIACLFDNASGST